MTTEITKVTKLRDTLQQAIKDTHALRKCTKKTEVIFLRILDSYEKIANLMLVLLETRKKLHSIYGKSK